MKSKKLKELLNRYFSSLESNEIVYAVIGNYENLPDATNNDVDFFVSNYGLAEQILYRIADDIGISVYLVNKTANGSNNYFYYYVGNGIEIIKIDLMIETSWMSMIPIIRKETIENNIIAYKNFYVVNKELESCMHLLYPLVTFNFVKDKYKDKLQAMSTNSLFVSNLNDTLGTKLAGEIVELLSKKRWCDVEKKSAKVKNKLLRSFHLPVLMELAKPP